MKIKYTCVNCLSDTYENEFCQNCCCSEFYEEEVEENDTN